MSDITFECPHCEKISTVPASFAGKRGKCPSCKQIIEVPNPYEQAETVGGPVEDSGSRSSGGASDSQDCPYCQERIKRGAKKCKHCGEYLDKRLRRAERRQSRPSQPADEMEAIHWVLCFLCPGIGCIVGIVSLIQGRSKRGGTMVGVSVIMSIIYNVLSIIARGAR